MKTKKWFDLDRNNLLLLPVLEIALFKNDFSLWVEFKWVDFSVGMCVYSDSIS